MNHQDEPAFIHFVARDGEVITWNICDRRTMCLVAEGEASSKQEAELACTQWVMEHTPLRVQWNHTEPGDLSHGR